MSNITTDAYLDFDQPWIYTGDANGNPNINTVTSLAAESGDESIVVESSSGFPASYPQVLPSFQSTAYSGANFGANPGFFALPEIGRVSVSTTATSGTTSITAFLTGELPVTNPLVSSGSYQITVGSYIYTVTNVSFQNSTSTGDATINLTSALTADVAAGTPIHIYAMDTLNTVSYLEVPHVFLTSPIVFSPGSLNYSRLTVSPLPYSFEAGTPLTIRQGLFFQNLIVRNISVATITYYYGGGGGGPAVFTANNSFVAGQTVIISGTGDSSVDGTYTVNSGGYAPTPTMFYLTVSLGTKTGSTGFATPGTNIAGQTALSVANCKITAMVTSSTTFIIQTNSLPYLAGGLFVGQQIYADGYDAVVGTISSISANSVNPVITVTGGLLGAIGTTYTYWPAFYAFYSYNATTFVNGVANGNYNNSGNTDAAGAIVSVQVNTALSPGDNLVLSDSYTATANQPSSATLTPSAISGTIITVSDTSSLSVGTVVTGTSVNTTITSILSDTQFSVADATNITTSIALSLYYPITVSQTATTIPLTGSAAPTGWLSSGSFQVTVGGLQSEIDYTGVSVSTTSVVSLTGVTIADGSVNIPYGATLTAYYSQIIEVAKAATPQSNQIFVKPFQPNYPFDLGSSLIKTYELSLDAGDAQEKIYPISAPISLNSDGYSAPYQVSLGQQLKNNHAPKSQVLWYQMPPNPNVADVCYRPDLDEFQMFDGNGWRVARVQSVQPIYTMLGANGGGDKELYSLYDPLNKTETQQDVFTNNSSIAYTTYVGSLFGLDPNNLEWTYDTLSRVQMHIRAAVPAGKQVAFRSLGMHIYYKSSPKVANVYVTPRDAVTFSTGEDFAIGWEYSDFDEDPQNGWQVRIFDEFTYNSTGFSPDTSTPIWSVSGNDDATQTPIDTTIGFQDNTNYYAYVRVSKSFQSGYWYGDWAVKPFVVDPAQPQMAMMAVYADGANAVNHLVIQSSDNLLSRNNADFPSSIGNWRTTGSDTAGTNASFGAMATHNTNKLSKSATLQSFAVGTTTSLFAVNGSTSNSMANSATSLGYLTFVGLGKGLPTSGIFWVNIGGTKATNGTISSGENVLLQVMATPGNYQVLKRNYAVPNGPTATALSSHAIGASIYFGLQQPVFSGATATMSWTETIKHTSRYPDYASVLVSSGSASAPVRFQIQSGNSAQHPNQVTIFDPDNSFYTPQNGKGKKINVYYTHWTVPQTNVSGTPGKNQKGKLKATTKVVKALTYEVATIKSVAASGPSIVGGWVPFGVTTADCYGSKTVYAGATTYHDLKTVPVKMTTGMNSTLFNSHNACLTQGALKAGTQIKFVNGSANMLATLASDWIGPNTQTSAQGDTQFHIDGIANGFAFQQFASQNGTASTVFRIPSGTNISVYIPTVPSSNKVITFEANTIGQGNFKGQYLSLGDYLETASIVSGGTAAVTKSVQTGFSTSVTYTERNHTQKFQISRHHPSGYTIQQFANAVPTPSSIPSTWLDNTTAPTFSQFTVNSSAAENYYQGWTINGLGVEQGTRVVYSSAPSSGKIILWLSSPATVTYANFTAANPNSYYTTIVNPSITLHPPAEDFIPAGCQTLYVDNFRPQTDYPASTPIYIVSPTHYSNQDEPLNSMIVQPTVNNYAGLVELSIYDGKTWNQENSVAVQPSGWYGFGAFAKQIYGAYTTFSGNQTSNSNQIQFTGAGAGSKSPNGTIVVGMSVNGAGIPAGTTVTAINTSANTVTLSNNPTSNVSGNHFLCYSVPTFALYIDWYDEAQNKIAISDGAWSYDQSQDGTYPPTTYNGYTNGGTPTYPNIITNHTYGNGSKSPFGIRLGSVGIDYRVYPNEVKGRNFYVNAIAAQAPYNISIVTGATSPYATFAYDQGTTSTGVFSLTTPATMNLKAGTKLRTTGGIYVTTTEQTAKDFTTQIPVRVTANPGTSATFLTVNAARACPRIQLGQSLKDDVYAISNVLFQAIEPPLPIDGSASKYTIFNTAIPALAAACDPGAGTGTALDIPASTPQDGTHTLWVFDPTNDNKTREIRRGSAKPKFSAHLTEKTYIGAKTIRLSNVDDLANSGTIVLDYGGPNEETVTINVGSWNGSLTVPLKSAVWYEHAKGTICYTVAAGLEHEVAIPQPVGTYVMALTWNNAGWINEKNDTYTFKVERTEDNGSNWATVRRANALPANDGGFAQILDYECSPLASFAYRVTAKSVNNDTTKAVAGLTTPALSSPKYPYNTGVINPSPTNSKLAVTSWWISSSSDDTLRYPILVQDKVEETQKHPVGVFYPLGSSRPYTIAGVVQGRDSKITVIWTDEANWDAFLNLLNLGETLVLIDPVESARRYIFIQSDVQVTHHASVQPYREVVIDYVEAAPPGYGYTYGKS